MDGNITIKYLQDYLWKRDLKPGMEREYFLKLAEEVGEVARAMHKGLLPKTPDDVVGTLSEELWDVMYYVLALANLYGIDMETVIPSRRPITTSAAPAGPLPLRQAGKNSMTQAPERLSRGLFRVINPDSPPYIESRDKLWRQKGR